MKKQYLNFNYTFGTHIVETYHDGVIQKREQVWITDLDNYIEALEAEGYEPAVEEDELEAAKKHYEWCLEHLLAEPIECDGRCLSCDYYDTNDCPDRQ